MTMLVTATAANLPTSNLSCALPMKIAAFREVLQSTPLITAQLYGKKKDVVGATVVGMMVVGMMVVGIVVAGVVGGGVVAAKHVHHEIKFNGSNRKQEQLH